MKLMVALATNLLLWPLLHQGGPSAAWLLGPLQMAQQLCGLGGWWPDCGVTHLAGTWVECTTWEGKITCCMLPKADIVRQRKHLLPVKPTEKPIWNLTPISHKKNKNFVYTKFIMHGVLRNQATMLKEGLFPVTWYEAHLNPIHLHPSLSFRFTHQSFAALLLSYDSTAGTLKKGHTKLFLSP